jgi:hypothetical protein
MSDSIYGFCPICNGNVISRERRPNGDDRCINGHSFPSRDTLRSKDEVDVVRAFCVAICPGMPDLFATMGMNHILTTATELINDLKKRTTNLEYALQEIAKGTGAFSRAPLTHADNCIIHMKEVAQAALDGTYKDE